MVEAPTRLARRLARLAATGLEGWTLVDKPLRLCHRVQGGWAIVQILVGGEAGDAVALMAIGIRLVDLVPACEAPDVPPTLESCHWRAAMSDFPGLRWQGIGRSTESEVARQIHFALAEDVAKFVEAQSSPLKIRDALLQAHERSELGPSGLFALECLLKDLGPAQRLATFRREIEMPAARNPASDSVQRAVLDFGAAANSTATSVELEESPGSRGLYPVGGVVPVLAEREVTGIIAKLARDGSDHQATALLQLAGAVGHDDARAAVRPFLSHPLEYRRAFAAQTLGLLGDDDSFTTISSLLPLESACPLDEDRYVAVEAIAIGLVCLTRTRSPEQRAEVLGALERVRDRIYGPARRRLSALLDALDDGPEDPKGTNS